MSDQVRRPVVVPIIVTVTFSEVFRVRVDSPEQASDNGIKSLQQELRPEFMLAAKLACDKWNWNPPQA